MCMEVPNLYNGLDALRCIVMLLGIVMPSTMPEIPKVEEFWPVDAS